MMMLLRALLILALSAALVSPSLAQSAFKRWTGQQANPARSNLWITRSPDPNDDFWADIYRVTVTVPIPAGAILRVSISKQITFPSGFLSAVAFLRRFEIRSPTGSVWNVSPGGNVGMNLTLEGHYESSTEAHVWVVPADIPAGSIVAYRARARSYSTQPGNYYLLIEPTKGRMTVDVDTVIP